MKCFFCLEELYRNHAMSNPTIVVYLHEDHRLLYSRDIACLFAFHWMKSIRSTPYSSPVSIHPTDIIKQAAVSPVSFLYKDWKLI